MLETGTQFTYKGQLEPYRFENIAIVRIIKNEGKHLYCFESLFTPGMCLSEEKIYDMIQKGRLKRINDNRTSL